MIKQISAGLTDKWDEGAVFISRGGTLIRQLRFFYSG